MEVLEVRVAPPKRAKPRAKRRRPKPAEVETPKRQAVVVDVFARPASADKKDESTIDVAVMTSDGATLELGPNPTKTSLGAILVAARGRRPDLAIKGLSFEGDVPDEAMTLEELLDGDDDDRLVIDAV